MFGTQYQVVVDFKIHNQMWLEVRLGISMCHCQKRRPWSERGMSNVRLKMAPVLLVLEVTIVVSYE